MIRNELDVLLDKVQDEALRADLRSQIDRLAQRRSFGLVFEQHIPERVRLPQHAIRAGAQVVLRDDDASPTFEVVAVDAGSARLLRVRDPQGAYLTRSDNGVGSLEEAPIDALVVISEFGEPVLPGLRYLGSVERGGDTPFHVVINGENYHTLEALRFTHAGKVDCIYIDPPYNSGARDWKYNNDYVDENDAYRHSKWLAFMERRLKLAKELLDPAGSVLIVTIDEKEVHRLGLLLSQTLPSSRIQMVSSVINPKGVVRDNEFSRSDEYIYFVILGAIRLQAEGVGPAGGPVPWQQLRRTDLGSARGTAKGGPAQFYPIYVHRGTGRIEGVGEALAPDMDRATAPVRDGCESVFPIRDDGTEMNWGLTGRSLEVLLVKGYVKATSYDSAKPQPFTLKYLTRGRIADIESGRAQVEGFRPNGGVIARYKEDISQRKMATTNWIRQSHNAQYYGTALLSELLPGRSFPFPKSLYAVEDALRFFVGDNRNAIVLDFFAGSGTTAHAVMRLNRQDDGRRQCILVTNNEVSAGEAEDLRGRGHKPGDTEWEAMGIFEHLTRPRVTAAIRGETPEGEPIAGDYKFTDEFPMADGLEQNAAFLSLRYLDADDVDLGLAYDDVAPLLWLRAGAAGPIARRLDADGSPVPYVWTDRYGVLFDEDRWRGFVADRPEPASAAFIVTYSPTVFAGIAAELPPSMDTVSLYDTYTSLFLPRRGGA